MENDHTKRGERDKVAGGRGGMRGRSAVPDRSTAPSVSSSRPAGNDRWLVAEAVYDPNYTLDKAGMANHLWGDRLALDEMARRELRAAATINIVHKAVASRVSG
jgi:hypothetical protein